MKISLFVPLYFKSVFDFSVLKSITFVASSFSTLTHAEATPLGP